MPENQISNELVKSVTNIISPATITVAQRWLHSIDQPHSYQNRFDLASKISSLINEGKVSIEDVEAKFRFINEISGKICFLKKVIDLKLIQNDEEVYKKIVSKLPAARSKKFETVRDTDDWCLNYISIENNEIRIKFSEKHVEYKFNYAKGYQPEDVIKVIVISIDRKTGATLIYFDSPGKRHPHGSGTSFNEKLYYAHYIALLHAIFPHIEEIDIHEKVYKLLLSDPRLVKIRGHVGENAYRSKSQTSGNDLATDPEFVQKFLAKFYDNTHKSFSVLFTPEASDGVLVEEVPVRLYPRESKLAFQSIVLPEEVDYVVSTITNI